MHSFWTLNEDYEIGENSNLLERPQRVGGTKCPYAAIGAICRYKHPNRTGITYAAHSRVSKSQFFTYF